MRKGNPDFSTLQQVLKRGHGSQAKGDTLAFHAFDLLELAGEDLAKTVQYRTQGAARSVAGDAEPPVHIADHVIGAGEKLFTAMCERRAGRNHRQEDGRALSPFAHRRAWVKVKCTRRQEFVIVGWKKAAAKGRPFASLLMAQHEDGELVYKGKVGTGFSADELDALAAKMHRLERKTAPVEVAKADARGVTWLTPKLVAEVAFAEFTADGNIRHGSYLGLAKTTRLQKQ